MSPRPDRTARRPCCWRTGSHSSTTASGRLPSRRRSSPLSADRHSVYAVPAVVVDGRQRLDRQRARARVRRAASRRLARRLRVRGRDRARAGAPGRVRRRRAGRAARRLRRLRRAHAPRHRHRRDDRRPRRAARRASAGRASPARSSSASTSPTGIPGFQAANDRTLEYAARSEGALIPFVRLDLNEGPVEEAIRCLERGARGIKLHPRAQRFLPDDPRLEPVFAVASARRVPILIHGGRGLPPIADSLARLVERFSHADHRARGHRRPRRRWPGTSAAAAASSSTRPCGARSTCSTSTGSSRRNRCSTPPTTRTGGSRTRC